MSHDSVAQQVIITPVLPAAPLVLCAPAFLTTLGQVEREVAHITITDAQSAQAAANLLQRLTSAGSQLEKVRTDLKAPYLAIGRQIDDAARAPAKRIEDAKTLIKRKTAEFAEAERRRVVEEERKRREEIARLEAQRKAEEEAVRKRAEELAKATPPVDILVIDDDAPAGETIEYGPPKTPTELALEKARYSAPAPVAAPVGVRWNCTLRIKEVDVKKLPEPFVIRTADMVAIRKLYCQGWKEGDPVPEVAGVTFEIDKQPVSTGRSVF